MKGIAGVVVLYYPEEKEVVRNIQTYLPFLDQLIVIDNTGSGNKQLKEQVEQLQVPVQYIAQPSNLGIAAALNKAAAMAYENNYRWLLTMDQDSYFEVDEIAAYFDHFSKNFYNDGSIAVVAPSIEGKGAVNTDRYAYAKTTSVITSGSLLQLAIWKQSGKFDEKLFIDEVDHEYCYRVVSMGFAVIQYHHIQLKHSLGSRKLAGYIGAVGQRSRTLHSPVRVYFIVRNYLYVRNKYKNLLPEVFRSRDKGLLVILKNNLFFSGYFLENLKSIVKALADYRKGDFSARI